MSIGLYGKRVVHKAAKVAHDGSASAVCFAIPHPIDMKRASWTLIDRFVTCRRCRHLLKENPQGGTGNGTLQS